MGALADGFVAYAQPLLDQTDGSEGQLNKAFSITQFCYNLALMPEESREQTIDEMQSILQMDDKEFADFRRLIVLPMIRRHQEMFPHMHTRGSASMSPSGLSPRAFSLGASPSREARGEAYPGTDRYAPCPCNSGRKYKFCCGKKGP